MGDSITGGQYLNPALRWTALIHDRLKRSFEHLGIEIDNVNRGVSGETACLGLERYRQDVQDLAPHVLTLQFGLLSIHLLMTSCHTR